MLSQQLLGAYLGLPIGALTMQVLLLTADLYPAAAAAASYFDLAWMDPRTSGMAIISACSRSLSLRNQLSNMLMMTCSCHR